MTNQNIDNGMRLLAGKPIYVDDIPIRPLTLGEIVGFGFTEFQQRIALLTISLNDMIEAVDDFEFQAILKANRHQYKSFDLFMMSEEMRSLVIESFQLIFRTDDIVFREDEEFGVVLEVAGQYMIHRENFGQIADVIQLQNNPSSSDEDEDDLNPADELARGIAEKLKRAREIAKKSKEVESDNEGATIEDIVSSVTAVSNSINKLNVWDYTLYQIYDEFARLIKIDSYHMQVQASMFASDVEIEHWSEPL